MTPCPECERNKFRAAMWRAEAYKQAGNDIIERPWIGLTDEEIQEFIGPWGDTPIRGYTRKLFDQIEAKLKEKNG
jgi:hypothetical protein